MSTSIQLMITGMLLVFPTLAFLWITLDKWPYKKYPLLGVYLLGMALFFAGLISL